MNFVRNTALLLIALLSAQPMLADKGRDKC